MRNEIHTIYKNHTEQSICTCLCKTSKCPQIYLSVVHSYIDKVEISSIRGEIAGAETCPSVAI